MLSRLSALSLVSLALVPLACHLPGTRVPHDLAEWSRLSASGTRVTAPATTVQEETQSIATVRDDDPSTAWNIPIGDSTVRVDWQPWLAAQVGVDSVALSFTGGPPDSVRVSLESSCGGPELRGVDTRTPDQPIALDHTSAGCLELRLHTSAATNLATLHVMSSDPRAAPSTAAVRVVPVTAVRHPGSGAVEGFYGVPWSWRERRHMITTLAANGMDTYIYAPKSDPFERAQWREPFPPEELQELLALHRFAAQNGVHLYLGISPFLDFDASSDTDYRALIAKLQPLLAAGFKDFVVLADDIEQNAKLRIDGALGRVHGATVNRLLADLRSAAPESRVIFVPTLYSEDRASFIGASDGYLDALKSLDPAIQLMWTGNSVANETINAADLRRVTARTGRRPVLWDNYYANDMIDSLSGEVLLAPYSGRSADLPAATEGIVNNLSNQGALSRLALSMVGDYLDHPTGPDADRARARAVQVEQTFALRSEGTAKLADDLMLVTRAFNGSFLQSPGDPDLRVALATVTAALGGPPSALAGHASVAARLLQPLSGLDEELRRSAADPDLVDELVAPLQKVRHESTAGLATLQWLAARQRGTDDAGSRAAAEAALAASEKDRFVFGDGEVARLHDAVAAMPAVQAPGAGTVAGDARPAEAALREVR